MRNWGLKHTAELLLLYYFQKKSQNMITRDCFMIKRIKIKKEIHFYKKKMCDLHSILIGLKKIVNYFLQKFVQCMHAQLWA